MVEGQDQNGLRITHQEMDTDVSRLGDDGCVAWRVAYEWNRDLFAIPIQFARERDAMLAKQALLELGIFFGSPHEIKLRARSLGMGSMQIRQVMLEALEW
ncbi:MAG: hypothetical protein NXI32_08445 [bacterium]|nr:hypothetical protein [bacterium]